MKRRTRLKLRRRIEKEVFGYTKGIDLPSLCKKIERHRSSIRRLRSYYMSMEKDLRPGYDTYGYNTIESIISNLEYISDRFCCAFRLSWLVDVPEEVRRLNSLEFRWRGGSSVHYSKSR